MAIRVIAAASSGGKSVFDHAEILRDAHCEARKLVTYGCYRGTYRQALAAGLRLAWQGAKAALEEAEWQASRPQIPTEIANRIRELRDDAWYEPITRAGNERYSALLAQAHDLVEAARAALS